MPSNYSNDPREGGGVAYVQRGHNCTQAANAFGTSRSFAIKLMQRYRKAGSSAPDPHSGVRHAKLLSYLGENVLGRRQAQHHFARDDPRPEERHGVSASISGLSDMLRKAGYTYRSWGG